MTTKEDLVQVAKDAFTKNARHYRLSGHYEVTPDELQELMTDVIDALIERLGDDG